MFQLKENLMERIAVSITSLNSEYNMRFQRKSNGIKFSAKAFNHLVQTTKFIQGTGLNIIAWGGPPAWGRSFVLKKIDLA